MRCHECLNLFSRMYDGRLAHDERARFEGHLGGCTDCADQWELYRESLASLAHLSGEKAPEGFREQVLRRVAARATARAAAPWRLVFSPAGALLCAALLLIGAACGFFLAEPQTPFPSAEIQALVDSKGVVFLPGKDGQRAAYALVSVRDLARRPSDTGGSARPVPSGEPLYVGGTESTEFYLTPQRARSLARPPAQRSPAAPPSDTVLKAMLEDSY